MNIRDGICAYVAGGLGNQLFILAAAWEQSVRLGVPLYLDSSFGTVRGTRPFELDTLVSPGTIMRDDSPWRSVRLSKSRVIPIPRMGRAVTRSVFLEKNGDFFDPTINTIRPGTTLFGYFQSPMYFPSVREQMRAVIESAPETPEETDLIARLTADRRVTVHLRRGDYLDAPPERQVLASTAYATRAAALLRSMGMDKPLRIFTDSPELVRSELGGTGEDVEIIGDDGRLSPINTLKVMASGESFIMSNSSFSWWAAWLMQERRGDDTVVIAPRPWNESGTAKADLLQRDWISLDTR